jgi:hypothetical protein
VGEEVEIGEGNEAVCLNCAERSVGAFCPACGQSRFTSRYTVSSLIAEVYSEVRKLDLTTSARTVKELTIQPGEFVRGYLGGKRVGVLNPIKFFFYSFVVQVLFGTFAFWYTGDHQYDSLVKLDYRLEFTSLISTAFWGLFWALFFRSSGLNIVENVAAAIFFVGQANFLGLILNVIGLLLHNIAPNVGYPLMIGDVLVDVIYGLYFARRLFQEPLRWLIPKQILLSLLFVIVTLLVFAGNILIATDRR